MYWAAYEQAWFGTAVPGLWFSHLGIAIVDCEMACPTSTGGKRRLDTHTKKQSQALKKSDCLGLLARLPAGIARQFTSTEEGDGLPNRAWAAFLEFGPQQERKWNPGWANWLVAYAEAVRNGTIEDEARQAALAGIDAEAFERTLARWAPKAK